MLGDKFTLEYSPQFYDEISDAVRYITFKLRNPEAAQRLRDDAEPFAAEPGEPLAVPRTRRRWRSEPLRQPPHPCPRARIRAHRPFFPHTYWDLETTMTTFKNNIILRAHLEHSES